MKAIILDQYGSSEQLALAQLPVPEPQIGELLIHIKAAGINPIDYKTRLGKGVADSIQLPSILGWDMAGVVVGIGPGVDQYNIGDAVFGMSAFPSAGKAYAEYAVVKAANFTRIPMKVPFIEAAAYPMAALLAWQALVKCARIKAGDRILIHTAAGGVGHLAVQIAKAKGAYVIGTSLPDNRDFLASLALDEWINVGEERFEDLVSEVDVVLDDVGGEIAVRSIFVLKKGGLLISLPGPINDSVVLNYAKKRTVKIQWMEVIPNGEDMKAIAQLIASNQLQVNISEVYSLDEIARAHDKLESYATRGKLVLKI